MVLCGREAAHEAETGRDLFASVSLVMKGHVFAENGSRGAVQWGDKDGGHLADSQTVKNCAIQKHRCLAIYTRSLWGFTEVHFLRIYMATARLNVQLPCKYVRNAHSENPRESAYKRGGTGVVQIQKFSRFGQRDGQCLSRSNTRLHGSRCPHKPAKTAPSTSINTQENKNRRVSGA